MLAEMPHCRRAAEAETHTQKEIFKHVYQIHRCLLARAPVGMLTCCREGAVWANTLQPRSCLGLLFSVFSEERLLDDTLS